MARGENPGTLLDVQTTLTYDKDQRYGHASAGKDLVLSIIEAGADAGKANLGVDDGKILGKFVELHRDGKASYMPSAMPMILRKSSADIIPGRPLLCAGAGQVKSAPTSSASVQQAFAARGQTVEILESGDNGRILALMP